MKIIIVVLLTSMFLLSGCPFDGMMGDIFEGIPGYNLSESSNSGNSNNQQPTTNDQTQDPLAQNQMDNMQELPEPFCQPHGYFDGMQCVCDSGYVSDGTDCVPGNRECVYDKDCITKVNNLGCQSEGYRRKVARCNLRTYTCSGEYIDCRDYGNNYVCRSNQCLPMIIK
ncbi:MAG: hypothetical protein U9R08_00235 [Nanoarchaeota archaeon]|nr:hypothetical protein [Nanoarchaeota archaeon]